MTTNPNPPRRSGGHLAVDGGLLPDLETLGLTYRQFDYWVRCGYLRPLVAHPYSGNRRIFPPEELEVAEKMARLVAVGCNIHLAHRVARGVTDVGLGVHITVEPRQTTPQPVNRGTVVASGPGSDPEPPDAPGDDHDRAAESG